MLNNSTMNYIFKTNKYATWYFDLIDKAKQRKTTSFKERHHIIPRSLGGNNEPNNLVDLTCREHFIAHLLLIRIVQDKDIYRMIHAIIRFTKKVKNSKEYHLLRRYVSTYSKGSYNKSYNKIWARIKLTNEIIYIDKSQFDPNIHLKGIGVQRGGFSNYMFINDGLREKMISKESTIPNGWSKGRLVVPTSSHMKNMTAKRHTVEKDLEHSAKMSGSNHFNFGKPAFTKNRIWVNNSIKSKMIDPNTLDEYLSLGWHKGRLK